MNNNDYVTEVNLRSTTHDTLALYRGYVYTCIMLVFSQNELIQHNNYMCMHPCQSLHLSVITVLIRMTIIAIDAMSS